MTLTSYTAGNLQWLGIARETTRGTAASAPAVWVPIVSPKYQRHTATLPDDALRGSMSKTFGQQQGMVYPELSYTTFPYLDSCYPHFLAALGTADAVTGSSDPWTHKTALLNASAPPSYTLWYDDGVECWQIVGAQSSNLKIAAKVNALGSIEAGWIGISAATVTAPSNTPTSSPPMPSWTTTVTVGGVAATRYSEVGITVKRATEAMQVLNGTQAPGAIFVGELEVTADLNGIFQGSTDTDWAGFVANTQPAVVVTFAPAGDATHALTLQMSKVAYSDSQFSGSNKWMEIQSKLVALGNSTDALDANLSPIQAKLTTTVQTAY